MGNHTHSYTDMKFIDNILYPQTLFKKNQYSALIVWRTRRQLIYNKNTHQTVNAQGQYNELLKPASLPRVISTTTSNKVVGVLVMQILLMRACGWGDFSENSKLNLIPLFLDLYVSYLPEN